MCGRFVGFRGLEELMDHFPIDISKVDVYENFNVAPSQQVLAIARYEEKNHLVKFNWGLVPLWAKDKSVGNRMINARSETAATKPSFRSAFRKRRCLILADGFFEWKGDKGKEPVAYRSCTILTREASLSVRPIHHRMPVILKPEAYGPWLDPGNQDIRLLQDIIQNQIYTELTSKPVSKRVNSVRNNSQENIRQIELF